MTYTVHTKSAEQTVALGEKIGSFLKKDTKQYKIEINKSSQILDKWRKIYVEDK